MSPYQAQRQSLHGVGSPEYFNTAPDYGHLIDSISGAASSLVQQAYNRRLQQHEQNLRDQEFQLQKSREAREAAAQERGFQIQEEGNRIRKLQAGVVPAHDEVSFEEPAAAAPQLALPKPIGAAAISGLPAQQGTTPLTSPVNVQAPPTPRMVTRHVDESFDPTQSAAYVRSVGLARVRGEQVDEEIDRRDKAAASRQAAGAKATAQRQEAHDKRVAAEKAAARNDPKSMTAGQRATWGKTTGDALLAEHGGNFEDARDFLNSEAGKQLRDAGLTETDLYLSHGRATGRLAQQAVAVEREIQKGVSPTSEAARTAADSAVARVQRVGQAARTSQGSAKPKAQTTTIDPDSITDEELVAAHAAGARTTDAVKAFVATHRKAKPKPQ